MERRFPRSIYDELDELRASMDYLYQLALPADNPLLPEEEDPGIVCQYLHNLDAEVTGHDDEVTVTVDMTPGTGNSTISVELINEKTLKILCDRVEDRAEDDPGKSRRDQRSFSIVHVIPLPDPVMKSGSKASMRNGVLDIRFKKMQPVPAETR